MIIDCISDLHGHYPKLDGGDLLIVAGDLTANNRMPKWAQFFCWIEKQPYKKKIIVPGNHDTYIEKSVAKKHNNEPYPGFLHSKDIVECLCDSGTEFEGLKIWGSPWTPWFHKVNPKCKAFMISESKLKAKWSLIPDDIDILITHGPPYGKLDKTSWGHCGSITLDERVKQIRPKLHIFGHIHEGYHEYGGTLVDGGPIVQYFNASHVNEHYQPVNKPIRIIL